MKALKILLMVAGGLIALAAIAVAVFAVTFKPDSYKPELVALVKEKTGRTLDIDGPLGLTFFPKLGVSVGKTQLSEVGGGKTFASLTEAKVSLALMPLLSGQVVVDRVVLTGLSAEVVTRKDGRTNIDDLTGGASRDKTKPAEKSAPPAVKLDIAGIEVTADNLVLRDEREARQTRVSALKLTTGRIAEDAPGKLELKARVQGEGLDVIIDVAGSYRLSLGESKLSLSELAVKIAGEAPSAPKPFALALTGNVTADWVKETANGELTAKFDDSTAKTKFEVKGFSPSAIRFDAEVDRLDLDRYAGQQKPAGPAADSAAGAAADKPAAEQPIDLSGLKGLNLTGEARIGQLTVAKLKIEKVRVGLRVLGGRVDVNPVAASLYGGTLAGSATLNANGNQIALKQQLTGINIGPLLRDAMGRDALEGRGNVTLEVQTAGQLPSALKRALAGTASFRLEDGAVKGINLADTFRKAKSMLGSKSAQEQGASSGDKTDFSEMTASFVIRNGVAHNDDLSAKAPFLRLGGSGDIDIGAGNLNYLAKAAVVNTSGGQGGKDLESLAGLTIPVRLSGPFDAVKYKIEFGSVATDAVKQKVQETLKSGVQDKLKNLLKR